MEEAATLTSAKASAGSSARRVDLTLRQLRASSSEAEAVSSTSLRETRCHCDSHLTSRLPNHNLLSADDYFYVKHSQEL